MYSQGTLGSEDDDDNYVEIGDSSGDNIYYRAFFSFALATIPANAKAFTGGRLRLSLRGGSGNFYSLGPLLIEHVRISSISVSALTVPALQTLGADQNALQTSLVCFTSGTTGETVVNVGSAVAKEFRDGNTFVQFRFRGGVRDFDNNKSRDYLQLFAPGQMSLQVDVLVP